jgi:hypothetical protein
MFVVFIVALINYNVHFSKNSADYSFNAMIKVQPTSIARSAKVAKGSK